MSARLAAVGIDPAQWLALTRTYLLMDLRRAGGVRSALSTQGKHASPLPFAGLLVGAAMNSVVIGVLVFVIADSLTAALFMVIMAGMTISMLLLVDFAGSVVSAEDYWVVAPRPVSSRTYFAARLSAVLAYVITLALLMALFPALTFAVRHQLGVGGFAGALAAAVLSGVSGTALIIGIYTHLMARTSPARLVGMMSWIHLLASGLSMAGFLLLARGIGGADVSGMAVGNREWIWYMPVTWFAALVPALGGTGGPRELAAASGAVALTLALLWLAAGRISLEFASTMSEAKNASTAFGSRRRLERLPGFREGEAYAVATLVRAQFRYDLRFRLGVLGVLPMMLFYLAMGWDEGALADPFVPQERSGAALIYMPLAFLPMILHGALQHSEHWRAAWIFRATPADPARLVVATKNFVALLFIGGYLLVMGAFWALFYERIWHAVLHAAIVGAGAHMLLQAVVILAPSIPFSKEPARAEQSGRITVLFFVAMMASAIGPIALPFFYARPAWFAGLVAAILAGTYALERRLHRRARAYAGEVE